jgi:hypothetical protein
MKESIIKLVSNKITSHSRYMIVISLILIIAFVITTSKKSASSQEIEGIPITIKEEHRLQRVIGDLWTISLIAPEKYYSVDGLNNLFRYYSTKHSGENMIVRVYTNVMDYEKEFRRPACIALTDSRSNYEPEPDYPVFYSCATFYRINGNEWYRYAPDLNDLNDRLTVVFVGQPDPDVLKIK